MKDCKILAHRVWQCKYQMNSELKKRYRVKGYCTSTTGLDEEPTRK
jgi:hypothetical protein